VTKPLELQQAELIEALCRRYPAYTPEAAAAAPVWVIQHLNILAIAEADRG
jgi:hypothetical protein